MLLQQVVGVGGGGGDRAGVVALGGVECGAPGRDGWGVCERALSGTTTWAHGGESGVFGGGAEGGGVERVRG